MLPIYSPIAFSQYGHTSSCFVYALYVKGKMCLSAIASLDSCRNFQSTFSEHTITITVFSGVYLPLLWEPSFCSRSPIALGYTRGHFCALIPPEPSTEDDYNDDGQGAYSAGGASSGNSSSSSMGRSCLLPLVTAEDPGQLLPIHFLSREEMGREKVRSRDKHVVYINH